MNRRLVGASGRDLGTGVSARPGLIGTGSGVTGLRVTRNSRADSKARIGITAEAYASHNSPSLPATVALHGVLLAFNRWLQQVVFYLPPDRRMETRTWPVESQTHPRLLYR